MFVEVGFSDSPDTTTAGREAARQAVQRAQRDRPCDMALLFATSRHDAGLLRNAVARVLGASVPIVGGAAVGVITNDRFGYAGDQSAIALIWLENARCDVLAEGGLATVGEKAVGEKLGKGLLERGVRPDSTLALLYDAIDRSHGELRMRMASYLLHGLEQGMGFLPNIVGCGMQGDFVCSATRQWIGDGLGQHTALALLFSGEVRIDHTIMHGCHPATGYYTVTKADGQTILEINNRPALPFLDDLLESAVPVDNYPFFLILGVNSGEKWGPFDETKYANRLCLALDKERNGLVMFEPDMVSGTEFQIMYRSLDLSYMIPRIESLFSQLAGRKPVFALYIDCAGRAAGYAGIEMEDALVVQKTVAGRVPLLGVYSGVEIASVKGKPRGLDWTGVFCLFSVPE